LINFILIAVCLVAGMLIRRFQALPEGSHKSINSWLINIALPAVSFKYLPYIQWSNNLLLPALSPVVLWLCGWLYIRLYAAKTGISKQTEGGLKLAAGLSNTSFVGFPLIIAYFGQNNLSTGIICDQVTFTLMATAGIIVAIHSSGKGKLSVGLLVARVLRFPPFIACVAALILPHFISLAPLSPVFEQLASTVAPLALFSIGLQLQFAGWVKEWKHISVVLAYKLVLGPAIILGLFMLLKVKGIVPQVTLFEAAMPTFVSSAVIAEQYELNPRLLNLIIGIGIPLALGTTAAWYFIMQHLL
jgi:malate permease and related proteins